MTCNNLLNGIDNFKEFLTVEELNKELISLVGSNKIISFGKSKNGNSIIGTKIGKGKENALMFGFPHPNEPIGSLTCMSFIKILLKNKELQDKYTWYIIPCVDPDGAKLNEEWFKGDFTIKKYIYNFYRPAMKNQVEWSFPVKYKDYDFSKPTKSTQVLMNLMNKIKPKLINPLHNSGFGGAYFYITQDMPESYYNEITDICKKLKVPIDFGEPEMEFVKELKKPFYKDISFENIYDYFKNLGKDPKDILAYGTSTFGYAKNLNSNVFEITGEIPYIYDTKIFDKRKILILRKTLLDEKYKTQLKIFNFIDENLKNDNINKKNIFYQTLKDSMMGNKKMLSAFQENINMKEYHNPATVAEKFSSLVISRFYLSLDLGMFRRLLLDSDKNSEQIKELIVETEKEINNLVEYIEKNSNYKVIPIKKLVQLQLGCLLISLDYL